MVCNINRSITVGVLTALVMTLIVFIWVGPDNMRAMNFTTGNLLLLIATLFVISVSIDVFNQCYTKCNSLTSSLSYGFFTVAIIYLFYSLFIRHIEINERTIVIFIVNVLILAGLHGLTCRTIHSSGYNIDTSKRERIVFIVQD